MKSMSFTTPVLIAALSVTATWGLGMLAVRSGAASTQTSLDLLRLNLRVARLHEALLEHSREALTDQMETLRPARKEKVSMTSMTSDAEPESAARPWPETEMESVTEP